MSMCIFVELNSTEIMVSALITAMYSWTGDRLRDFNVGLSRERPEVSNPRDMDYCICSQYLGTTYGGQTIQVKCSRRCDTGRFVIVHMPNVTEFLSLEEVQVYEGLLNSNNFSPLLYSVPVLVMHAPQCILFHHHNVHAFTLYMS